MVSEALKEWFKINNASELFRYFILERENFAPRKRSENTIASIKFSFKHLEPYLRNMKVEEIDDYWWAEVYIPEKKKATHPNRKFMNDRKWLLAFLKWAHAREMIAKVPILENPDPPLKTIRVYSKEEIEKIVRHSSGDLRLQILFAYLMGMRKTEILHIKWGDIDWHSCTLEVSGQITKTREYRKTPIHPIILKELKNRPRFGPYVFNKKNDLEKPQRWGIEHAWQRLKKAIKLKGTFHDLRKTHITEKVQAGVPIVEISRAVGCRIDVLDRRYINFQASNKYNLDASFLDGALSQVNVSNEDDPQS